MLAWAGKLKRDRRGATAVEYGFIIALVVLMAIGAIRGLAGRTIDVWTDVSNKVVSA